MAYQDDKNSITISRKEAGRMGGFVVLPLKKYEKLREQAVPTYYLKGKEAEELDRLVTEGLKEYEEGKTIKASSIREALKSYGKKNKNH